MCLLWASQVASVEHACTTLYVLPARLLILLGSETPAARFRMFTREYSAASLEQSDHQLPGFKLQLGSLDTETTLTVPTTEPCLAVHLSAVPCQFADQYCLIYDEPDFVLAVPL